MSAASLWPWGTRPGCFSRLIAFFFFLCHFLFNTKSTRMFILSQTPIAKRLSGLKCRNYCFNVKTNTDPIFEHPVFDSSRNRVKCVIKQVEKPQEALEDSLYTCFKCGSNNIFSITRQARSPNEGTSVFNKFHDCHNKWRDG